MSFYTRRRFGQLAAAAIATVALAPMARAAKTHTVKISGHKFVPANLEIGVGDTVTFVNEDGAPHTATAKNGSFDTGRLGKGKSGSVTMADAGRFDYLCAVHPGMKGAITVKR